jgi:DNA polymerase III epsilon subunit-like protein
VVSTIIPLQATGAPGDLTARVDSPWLLAPTRTAARRRPAVDTSAVNQAVRAFERADAVCIFDLETTDKMEGTHKEGPHAGEPYGRVMQLAARRYERSGDRWRLVEELNILIDDPDVRDCCLATKAAEVHGISIADLRGPGPNPHLRAVERLAPQTAWKRFLRMADGAPLMGQNIIGFDIPFANRELARHGFTARLDDSDAIDTLIVARALYDLPVGHKQPGYRLRSLADRIGVQTDPALDHNALGDIDTCWQVWMAMQDDLDDFRSRFLGRKPDQYRGSLGRVA